MAVVLVKLGQKLKFTDLFTWIVQDFLTVIPCSPMMPIRWKVMWKCYCATPEIRLYVAPTRLRSELNRMADWDFAMGLGRGVFTTSQMDQY